MNRNIIYFINPVSGTKNKDAVLKLIDQRTKEMNIPFQILHTNAAGDYGYLEEKIKNENITDIIICGGDGTVNQLAAALLHVKVNFGIIPLGSGNGLAFTAGIPANPTKALDIIFKNRASCIDGFYINEKFSCMLCGLGFDALVAGEFAVHPSRGLSAYVKLTVKNFFRAQFYPFVIEANGAQISTEAFFISIANSNQFGNNFTIAPRASLNDGLLDIVVVKKMSKIKLVWSVLKQIRMGKVNQVSSNKFHQKDILYFHARRLEIKNPSLAPMHIDGEPATTSANLEIRVIENAFCLLQP